MATTTEIMQRLASGSQLEVIAAQCILLSSNAHAAGKTPLEHDPSSAFGWLAHALNGLGNGSNAQIELGVSEFVKALNLDGVAEFVVATRDAYEVLRIAGLASIEIVEAGP